MTVPVRYEYACGHKTVRKMDSKNLVKSRDGKYRALDLLLRCPRCK